APGSAANGEAARRSRTISRISSTRGLMMRTNAARETTCGGSRSSSPTGGTVIMSRSSDAPEMALPCSVLMRSASASLAVRPRAEHAARVANFAALVQRIGYGNRMQHGAAGAHRMAAARREHAIDIGVGRRRAADMDARGVKLARHAAGAHREHHGLHMYVR